MKVYLTERQFKNYVHYLKEETVGNLMKKLQKYPKDMNVDCNDGNGGYSSIKGVKKQGWNVLPVFCKGVLPILKLT